MEWPEVEPGPLGPEARALATNHYATEHPQPRHIKDLDSESKSLLPMLVTCCDKRRSEQETNKFSDYSQMKKLDDSFNPAFKYIQ